MPAQSQVDVFFFCARSKRMLFIKWVLAVLFCLQILSYFCIGMSEWMIVLRIVLRNGQPPYSVMRILMLCIVFLYIVSSSSSSSKVIIFCGFSTLNPFLEMGLILDNKKKKQSVYLNRFQCGVLYLRYFYFCRFKKHVHRKSISGISVLCFFSFCF